MSDKLREFEERSERFRHSVTVVSIIVTLCYPFWRGAYTLNSPGIPFLGIKFDGPSMENVPHLLGIADKIGDFILE